MTSAGRRRVARHTLWVCALFVVPAVHAQTTTLSITSGSTATFPNPTVADYVAGYVDGATVTYTVSLNGGPNGSHTTTVEICATATTLGSGKALSNLLWQPTDNSKPWQAITTGCTGAINPTRVVAAQSLTKGNSWSGGVRFRMLLSWNDTAASYSTPVEMTVAVSTP